MLTLRKIAEGLVTMALLVIGGLIMVWGLTWFSHMLPWPWGS